MSTKDLKFEQAVAELESITKKLENEAVNLDEAISLFERGNQLRKFCDDKLSKAKLEVEKIVEENEKIAATKPENLDNIIN